MASLGTLAVNIGANTRPLQQGLQSALASAKSFASGVMQTFTGMQLSNLFTGAVQQTKQMAISVVKLAADAELAQANFGTLLGDVDKGVVLFRELEKFAARTSFTVQSAGEAAQMLLAKGVGESEVLVTMEMLGNLAMGNAERLSLIAKAYTDVQAKGRLMAQEQNQFAENGINLFEALQKTLGKNAAELMAMREAGQITFAMVKNALIAATTEGGRFNGAMEKANKTFIGQYNSLMEGVQTLGRMLGQMVLPEMTKIVTKMNLMLQGFMEMPHKMLFVRDALIAITDVAFAYIAENWAKLLWDMTKEAAKMGSKIAAYLNPFAGVKAAFEINAAGVGDRPLAQSMARLKALMTQLEQMAPANVAPNIAKLAEGALMNPQAIAKQFSGMFSPLQTVAVDAFETALKNVPAVDLTKAIGGWLETLGGNTTPIVNGLKTWLGTQMIRWDIAMAQIFQGKEKLAQKAISMDPRNEFAGAVQQGTAEAYAAIAAALRQDKDPAVQATEEQTDKLLQPLEVMANALKNGFVQKVIGNLLD